MLKNWHSNELRPFYGAEFDGALICLKDETGKQLWQTYDLMDGEATDCSANVLVPQDRVW